MAMGCGRSGCAYPSLAYTEGVSDMVAVVETEEFLADVKGVLSEDEHDDLILYIAQHPEAGDLMPATGGLRKLRWAAKGKGKRGGSRVIYYYHNIEFPVFLMAIFAKNIQIDLSARQRAALNRQLQALRADWKEKKSK
jgi:mRNA-degrading endonuclease RelE of RelBE toxin-antitoxin system